MLAEWEDPAHMEVFNMNYGWHFHHLMNEVAKGDTNAKAFEVYAEILDSLYDPDDLRMYFTTNHDENSWNGTIKERFGNDGLAYFVLASTYGHGMPLIYSGQEMGLDHRLSFFGKDLIGWKRPELVPFYQRSLELKHKNPALWNGLYGGRMELISVDNPSILAYTRVKDDNEVVVFLNLGNQEETFAYNMNVKGEFLDWYNGVERVQLEMLSTMTLDAQSFKVYVKNQNN
jgi:glycosidase